MSGEKNKSHLHDQFRTLLQMNHHRITPERFIVLDEICTMQTHFDVEDIVKQLKNKQSDISRATVYRTVELLERYGLIRKAKLTDLRSYYELTLGRHHHEHMICTACGKVIEFESKDIETIQETICKQHRFSMTYHFLHIFGICEVCRLKA
jgi:Fur family transcriptional regulator, ferric uptake regulator